MCHNSGAKYARQMKPKIHRQIKKTYLGNCNEFNMFRLYSVKFKSMVRNENEESEYRDPWNAQLETMKLVFMMESLQGVLGVQFRVNIIAPKLTIYLHA